MYENFPPKQSRRLKALKGSAYPMSGNAELSNGLQFSLAQLPGACFSWIMSQELV